MKILIADDELNLRTMLAAHLKHAGYEVTAVSDGEEAVKAASEDTFDVMVFDIMMPNKDGVEALKEIREKGILTPVILSTAKGDVEDRITGLDAGADDYLTKPFSMGELLARIRAAARRGAQTQPQVPAVITVSNVSLNKASAELSAVNSISLAAKEMKLFELLASNQGRSYTGEELFGKIWSDEPGTSPKVVEMYISYLR
ncbi:MAG: response regulator transcription factor, partial [Oscillospiraceae bacterium]|nr:response regulator transcription factor [Oscillospiraceae bacterium]